MRNKTGLIGVPAIVIATVVMLVVPVPAFIIDILISLNISAAIVIMLMTMHVKRALDFSVFPAVLLVATLFRLALNVSVTRLVLLHGSAGAVVASFGKFVVGGQLVVGLVVFLILIVIQFVVVTSGAGRVAEVAARFTLDAMPGKQMAIDADLNAGLIDQATAKRRRQETADEADFYGAMDGASKFVRGDAIAAVVITVINLVGGLGVGVLGKHQSVTTAVHTYSLLSIGDGLASQIPALLLSISTGLIVTRAATDESDFGTDVIGQLRRQHGAIKIAGVVMAGMAIVPGLPHVAFLIVGAVLYFFGRRVSAAADATAVAAAQEDAVVPASPDTPQALALEMRVEPLELELSVSLIDLVDGAKGGDLLDRVKGLRRKLAIDKGLIIPPVRTRDNIALDNDTYTVRVHGVEVARGTAPPGKYLAIGDGLDMLPGIADVEPVFGLPAKWVAPEVRQQALIAGSTVIDRSSVITTHLGEIAARYASQLLSSQQVKILVDSVKATDPAVIDEMAAAQVTLTDLHRVMAGLLDEGVAIRDLVRIIEAVTERARQTKDPESLLEAARAALGSAIASQFSKEGLLPVIMLDAGLERSLVESVSPGEGSTVLNVDPRLAEGLVREIQALATQAEQTGREPVLVCPSRLRPALRRLLAVAAPRLGVLSVNELSSHVRVERIGVVNVAAQAV
ncbi:flagellar biosynthesis protein FlhA [Acidiferrimicrobium sp. IK]|uniref:flagellar biosynthesis protein FlhA n=1 Tax=Acidiferrimicrobium sp. IK TaxID=2871700 RepID=UPI0021CAFB3A|nr:flagellar biosynthesis protein FlhA [Acidiferrimicrobium sp. IK]MCU4185037.1 flagellar biosynthesis protein FlhA [Acidiferrimicrobium sp. IK]